MLAVSLRSKAQSDSDKIMYRGDICLNNNIATVKGVKITAGGENSKFFVAFPSRNFEITPEKYASLEPEKQANYRTVADESGELHFYGSSEFVTPITKEAHDDVYSTVAKAMEADDLYAQNAMETMGNTRAELVNSNVVNTKNGDKFFTTSVHLNGYAFNGITANLKHSKDGHAFISINYPGYKTQRGDYVQYFHFREDGKGYDPKMKEPTEVNYKRIVEGMIVKECKAQIPEWAQALEANKTASKTAEAPAEDAMAETEPMMSGGRKM